MNIVDINEREKYTLWRRRNRVRLLDVAHYCGVSAPLLSMWENGKVNISPETLEKYNEFIKEFEEGRLHANNE